MTKTKTNIATKEILFKSIKELIESSRKSLAQNINSTLLLTYYEIGMYIVENEQKGKLRAEYAAGTLTYLSKKLAKEFGRGFTERNLELMRKFYSIYSQKIPSTISRKLPLDNSTNVSLESSIPKSMISELKIEQNEISKTLISKLKLSWSHYIILMRISNKDERNFYETETMGNNWSVRALQREYNSSLYERIALSKKKNQVKQIDSKDEVIFNSIEFLKEPYVLEFLELKEETSYTESQLEEAIINKIEKFLMELGKGFLFDSRQKRFSFDGEDFYIDLVFYNRLLKCFVLIDLKIGKLTHQDIGQLQMYVNYYDRKIKAKDENKTIGIILCKQTNKAVVEFTLPEDNEQIFAREYKLYLPSKSDLQKLLQD